jgi:mRNA-degrading endonuclease RelE of RelBE toxin-antitoxin system
MWAIEFSRDALKALMRMPRGQALRIRRSIDDVACDPHGARNYRKLARSTVL